MEVDQGDLEVVSLDRVVPAKAGLDLRSLVPAIDRVDRVAAVEESNDRDDRAVAMMAADRGFLVAAIDQEDRAMAPVLVAPVTVIVPAVREAAIVRADQVMEIAQGVLAMGIVREDLAITTIAQAVLVIGPIGPTVRIGRIVDRIGTNGKIGGTIAGRT